jgi:hypothetical protein
MQLSKRSYAAIAIGMFFLLPELSWAEKPPWAGKNMPTELETCEEELEDCLEVCVEEPCIVFPGDGYVGADLQYEDNDDGTFTDLNTGLVWEIKTLDGSIHDVNNTYTWTDLADGDYTNPDGTAFAFIDELNKTKFAGYTDWRLPTVKELQSLIDYSNYLEAVDPDFPGEVVSYLYWSSTSHDDIEHYAWGVGFRKGKVFGYSKFGSTRVRAVRGGL